MQASNGFGFPLQARVLPGLKVGGADYWALGGQGIWLNLEWGADYVRQNSGDLTFIPVPAGGPAQIADGFSANGVELYSKLSFGRFSVMGGFNEYMPFDPCPLINAEFKTRYAILCAEWYFSPSSWRILNLAWETLPMPKEREAIRSGPRVPLRLHMEDPSLDRMRRPREGICLL